MQFTRTDISYVVPSVMIVVSKWKRMEVTNTYRKLCDLLIVSFMRKFKYELESAVYGVASLLNVGKLHEWLKRSDCIQFRKFAIDNIAAVATSFLDKKNQENLNTSTTTTTTVSNSRSCNSLSGFLREDNYESDTAMTQAIFEVNIEKEKIDYLFLIEKTHLKDKSLISTSKFWLNNQTKFPTLYRLALILYNIPASSAYIERFYSICGNVCTNRSGNMTPETIINRSMLKANIAILNELTMTQFND